MPLLHRKMVQIGSVEDLNRKAQDMKLRIRNKTVLLILLIIALSALFSCKKKEEAMIETDLSNMPVKVLYRRMWEYSLDVESEDQQIINDLLEKIDRIQLGEKTDMGIEDYTDLIVFEYPDGTTNQYRFEADVYVEDDKNRYLVLSGLQDVRSILNAMVEGRQ